MQTGSRPSRPGRLPGLTRRRIVKRPRHPHPDHRLQLPAFSVMAIKPPLIPRSQIEIDDGQNSCTAGVSQAPPVFDVEFLNRHERYEN